MIVFEIIISGISAILVLATIASLIKWDDWWIRVFDFPRIQIFMLIICTLLAFIPIYDFGLHWYLLPISLLMFCLLFQGYKIFPFTILARKQVETFKGEDRSRTISILVSNVLMYNHQSERLLQRVRSEQPDMLLTLETDQWWGDQLEVLESEYSYSVKVPLDNLYGMHLFSRLEIVEHQVNYLIQKDIPSIEALVKLPAGDLIRIYCLHPMPPSPTESDTSTNRDAEILLIGKNVPYQKEPTLVFGDLNDVAWSYTTLLFKRISGLMDPRIGRGFFSTFHAKYPLLRWPLDHVFHSPAFKLIKYKRLPGIGSDHYPIYTKLYLQENKHGNQVTPEADMEDRIEVREKIKNGHPIKEKAEDSKKGS